MVEIFLLLWVGGGFMDFCSRLGRNRNDGDIDSTFFQWTFVGLPPMGVLIVGLRFACHGFGFCLSWDWCMLWVFFCFFVFWC